MCFSLFGVCFNLLCYKEKILLLEDLQCLVEVLLLIDDKWGIILFIWDELLVLIFIVLL